MRDSVFKNYRESTAKKFNALRSETQKKFVKKIVKKPYDEAVDSLHDLNTSRGFKKASISEKLGELHSIAGSMIEEKKNKKKVSLANKILSKIKNLKL
jgi:hypothetical protein